jgi:hypothetical protein
MKIYHNFNCLAIVKDGHSFLNIRAYQFVNYESIMPRVVVLVNPCDVMVYFIRN